MYSRYPLYKCSQSRSVCDKESKIKTAPRKAKTRSRTRTRPFNSTTKNKIAVACAKLLNKVIPKRKALEDKSRSEKSSLEGNDPKRPIKINLGGTTIKINGEGCVLAQNQTPEGENTKRPIKLNIGGTKAQPEQWKMIVKIQSRRHTLDWWKCYLDSCASYHTIFVREFLRNIKEDGSTMDGNCKTGSVLLRRRAGTRISMCDSTRKGL